jgi:hypothetical protein
MPILGKSRIMGDKRNTAFQSDVLLVTLRRRPDKSERSPRTLLNEISDAVRKNV